MSHQQFDRRAVLGAALSGFFAFAMRHQRSAAFAAPPQGRAKRCLVLWMNGGPSQFETCDPKSGTATGGDVGAISTAVPGVEISEFLPDIATQMKDLSVIHCVTSKEGEHLRGQYLLHTGYPFVPGFPRPALGAVVSHEAPPADFPRYVTIGGRGFGPAYMGPEHAPFSISQPDEVLELMRGIRRRKRRIGLLQELGSAFDNDHPENMLTRRRSMVSRIETLVSTPFVEAVDLERETRNTRERYGDHPFGQGCLLARRLLETGVNFVEVQQDGWDTHANNFAETRELCGAIDKPWMALMKDLRSSGLLDETVVVWMGEFGRTPNINAQKGRDHFPAVTPVVIGGGGLAGGRVVGKTNNGGTEIEGDSYQIADLFATIFAALGISPAQSFTTSFDSPAAATNSGKVIAELS